MVISRDPQVAADTVSDARAASSNTVSGWLDLKRGSAHFINTLSRFRSSSGLNESRRTTIHPA